MLLLQNNRMKLCFGRIGLCIATVDLDNKIEWVMKSILVINKAITILLFESHSLTRALVAPCQLIALQEVQRSSGALPVSLCQLVALQGMQRSCVAAQHEPRSEFTPCRRWEPDGSCFRRCASLQPIHRTWSSKFSS